ncbi:hypothetical protein BpHYR1_036529 [Brachionus plicatilis]|uniref:Uncharacterized protein n=1 Tax=Brachionus plicatilis TaxID=10195 RepID=A0A3M7QMQ6_BRAPC|nr:hypothetical protein BpHYR1_036529 [Brachionus plicatilis]
MSKFRITRRELAPHPHLARVLHSVHTQTTPSLDGQLPFGGREKNISARLKKDQATQTNNHELSHPDETDDIYQSLDTLDSSNQYNSGSDGYELLDEAREGVPRKKQVPEIRSQLIDESSVTQDSDTEPDINRTPLTNVQRKRKLPFEIRLDTSEVDEYRQYVLPSVRINEKDFDSKKESYRRNLEILGKEEERFEQEIKRVKLFRISKLRIVDYLQKERIKLLDDIKRLKNLVPVC